MPAQPLLPDTEIDLSFSWHAANRMAQRHLTPEEVAYVVRHGRKVHVAGVVCCFLGKKDLARDETGHGKFDRLEGTTVLLDGKQATTVVTVYRNREAFKKMQHRQKYNLKAAATRSRLAA
ncbi:MAG: DUF4258 domain-containing protein, partial [Chloroflexi bacterium]|nr:DUF4258 domain-containing protein [Chloroflexota bacterium]